MVIPRRRPMVRACRLSPASARDTSFPTIVRTASPPTRPRLPFRPARTAFGTDVKNALLALLSEQSEALVGHLAEVAELATLTACASGSRLRRSS